jgi:uncharacterized membrane protein YeiH
LKPLPIDTSTIFTVIDFSGVLAGAIGGALEAKQNRIYQFDFVGVLGLGTISALGGGIARDLLLQHGPPLAFTDTRYLLIALSGALIGLICGSTLGDRLAKPLVWIDAAALGFFAVAGSTRALAAGLTFLPALVLGIVTAIGGGSLRDVFSGRSPKVFERGEPYAVVAAFASIVFLISVKLSGNANLATSLGLVAGFVLRAAALRFKWKTRPAR